jgi:hypothetical protein
LVQNYDKIRVSDSAPVYKYDCLACGGQCCAGTDVLIGPHDIYRVVTGETGRKLHLEHSHRFFEPRPPDDRPFMHYYLGPESGLPLACIQRRRLKDGPELCPFLAPAYVVSSPEDWVKARTGRADELPLLKSSSGSASGLCVLEQAKPVICRAYPLGRMGKGHADEGMPKLEYVMLESQNCRRFRIPDSQMTVKQYVEQWGLDEGYRQSDRVNEWRNEVQKVGDQQMRFLLGLLFYDFDGFPLQYLEKKGVPEPERSRMLAEARPKTFNELADLQMEMVRKAMDGQYPELPKP